MAGYTFTCPAIAGFILVAQTVAEPADRFMTTATGVFATGTSLVIKSCCTLRSGAFAVIPAVFVFSGLPGFLLASV